MPERDRCTFMLKELLASDLKAAQKAGAAEDVRTIRLLLAELGNQEIASRGRGGPGTLSDDEAVRLLHREAKKRREAIELYARGGRPDLVRQEESELAVILRYVPKQVGRDEIGGLVDKLTAKGVTEFSALMREVMASLRGRADGKLVSEIVRAKLEDKP